MAMAATIGSGRSGNGLRPVQTNHFTKKIRRMVLLQTTRRIFFSNLISNHFKLRPLRQNYKIKILSGQTAISRLRLAERLREHLLQRVAEHPVHLQFHMAVAAGGIAAAAHGGNGLPLLHLLARLHIQLFAVGV